MLLLDELGIDGAQLDLDKLSSVAVSRGGATGSSQNTGRASSRVASTV